MLRMEQRFCIHPTKNHTHFYNFGRKKWLWTEHIPKWGYGGYYGLHGGRGLRAAQNGHIWSIFVAPTRLLYGVDVQLLKVEDTENLERVQRQCLKQFQGLPDNTSNSVCLALLGIPPIETILHKNLLNMFVNMVRNENSIEYKNSQR